MMVKSVFIVSMVIITSHSYALTLEDIKADSIIKKIEESYGQVDDSFFEGKISFYNPSLRDMQDFYLEKVVRKKSSELSSDQDSILVYQKELFLGKTLLSRWRSEETSKRTISWLRKISCIVESDHLEQELDEEGESCAVCLEVMKFGESEDKFTQVSCGHFFHEDCLSQNWKSKHPASHKCPKCRHDLDGKLTGYQLRMIFPPPPLPTMPPPPLPFELPRTRIARRVSQLPHNGWSDLDGDGNHRYRAPSSYVVRRVTSLLPVRNPDMSVNYDGEALMENYQMTHRHMRVQLGSIVGRRRRWSMLKAVRSLLRRAAT
jgi:hypothetical protein